MHHEHLADLLFPDITKLPSDYEALYPERRLAPTALVTRLGPSPTGFIHLGNLYGALADERLAHQSDGVFFLRIEDTDSKREVAGAAEAVGLAPVLQGICCRTVAALNVAQDLNGCRKSSAQSHVSRLHAGCPE